MAIRYVNGASTPGGDGTTPGTTGPNRAYATLGEWELNEQTDLVAAQEIHTVRCVAGTITESATVVVIGWTVNSSYYIIVEAEVGDEHLGVLGAGVIVENASDGLVLQPFTPYTRYRDLEFRATEGQLLDIQSGGNTPTFERCILRVDGGGVGVTVSQNNGEVDFESCLIIGGDHCLRGTNTNRKTNLRNCTLVKGIFYGLRSDSRANPDVHNSASISDHVALVADWLDPTSPGSHNGSGDGTTIGTDPVTPSLVTADFTDYDPGTYNGDFSIAGTGSTLYNTGKAAERPALDITRQAWVTNDIGCYAYIDAAPGDDQIVTLGNAPNLTADAAVPTVDAGANQQITLGNAPILTANAAVPTIETLADQEITLGNAPQLDANAAVPTISVRLDQTTILANAPRLTANAAVPTVQAVVQHEVTLGNAPILTANAAVPTIQSGEDAIITLGNAPNLIANAAVPDVIGKLVQEITLGNAPVLTANAAVPQVEGVSDLPPVIETQTSDQVYVYGQSGVLAAPPHSIGTGDNPTWTLFQDNFGSQPGVVTWSINAATGDITYQINQLNANPDEQALNTKGPYAVTRRLTTTVAHADDGPFDVAVNVGNRTVQLTPGGKPVMTWTTKTVAGRGLEPTKDPSARVTQTYTVT